MIILHGTLVRDEFLLWAETDAHSSKEPGEGAKEYAPGTGHIPAQPDTSASHDESGTGFTSTPALLPTAATYSHLKDALFQAGVSLNIVRRQNSQILAWLPTLNQIPLDSSPMIGRSIEQLNYEAVDYEVADAHSKPCLKPWMIPALRLSTEQAVDLLCYCMGDERLSDGVLIGNDLRFWATSLRFAGVLIGKQQFLPGIRVSDKGWAACWEPVFLGEDGERLLALAKAMPGACRACQPEEDQSDAVVVSQDSLVRFLQQLVNHLVRKALNGSAATLPYRIQDDGSKESPGIHARWLSALLGESAQLDGSAEEISRLSSQIAEWRRPIEIASDAPFRLCLRLEEPELHLDQSDGEVDATADGIAHCWSSTAQEMDGGKDNSVSWYLRFLVQSLQDPSLLLSIETVLSPAFQELQLLRGGRVTAREYVFRALGQAVRLCPEIARSFNETVPSGIWLNTSSAHKFLSQTAPVLKNAGFSVKLPSWWTGKPQPVTATIKMPAMTSKLLTLDDIADFDWELALGGVPITAEELAALAQLKLPLIHMNGNWIELLPEQLDSILNFFKKRIVNRATGRELVRMALGDIRLPAGATFGGISGQGPVVDLVNQLQGQIDFEQIEPDSRFAGSLRPYQQRGLSWLEFLRKVGFGACLADDMGLGKTVQTLAFIQQAWHNTPRGKRRPSLLVCPTSVVSNWQKEARKFTPDLDILVHQGAGRDHGSGLAKAVKRSALVLTSYPLLHRDKDDLRPIDWETVILDEAQNIKNPEAGQTQAAMKLRSNFRIALSGTPVENSIGDLWSLMNFLNPDFLGRQADFKDRFFIPIQVYQDQEKVQQLKRLTAPFILRRLKTDKSIIADLPAKIERKTPCYLTKEQASLYAAVVNDATGMIDGTTGMKRRSLVLTTLLRLKQICDHPALFLTDKSRIAGRSGKLKRLAEMLQTVIARDEHALVFTQFAQMGAIIQSHIQSALGKEVLFLHGGINRTIRACMIERFQTEENGPLIFVLSLKAGGSGLNLTRANHVFHFDRWWNPAVEDQATDRAYRIGQMRDVQVHKYICSGTLEDRIDEIIERKKILASNAVGTGEGWLTELSTDELKDIFALRETALVD